MLGSTEQIQGFPRKKPNSRQVGVSGGHEDPLLVRPPLSIGHHLLDGSAHQAGATCHQDALGHLRHGQNPAGRSQGDKLGSPQGGPPWCGHPRASSTSQAGGIRFLGGNISTFLATREVGKGVCLDVTGLKLLSWRPPGLGPDLPRGTARPLEREGHLHPQVCAQNLPLHPQIASQTPNLPLHPRSTSEPQVLGLHPQISPCTPDFFLYPKSPFATRVCTPDFPLNPNSYVCNLSLPCTPNPRSARSTASHASPAPQNPSTEL